MMPTMYNWGAGLGSQMRIISASNNISPSCDFTRSPHPHLPPCPPQLDPDLSILDTMRQLLGGNDLLREHLGRVVDRICHASAPPSLFLP